MTARAALAGSLQVVAAMLLFRSLTVGLVAACFVLQLQRSETVVTRVVHEPARAVASNVTVIDASAAIPAVQLAALVRLGRDEHVTAVDDHQVANDLEAGVAIARHAGSYIDLTIGDDDRRVLLLLH